MFFSFFGAVFCNWLYAAETRSFYARSSSFKTQTGFCISLWYINTMQWFVKVNENLKYAFLTGLSHWCFRDLTDTTLAIKDANSKLVDVIMLMLTYWRGRLVTANSLTTALHRLHSFQSFCQNSGLACCTLFGALNSQVRCSFGSVVCIIYCSTLPLI